MKKKIAFVTSSRAEFGILKPLIKACKKSTSFEAKLIVTGTHLSSFFGKTEDEILNSGLTIDFKIPIIETAASSNSDAAFIAAKAMKGFTEIFEKNKFDGLVILGDRFEILSIAVTAFLMRIPIVHLHGGEKTSGSLDDSTRHAITKLSSLHFTSTEAYRKRVIQLGEKPDKVFNVGALGLDGSQSGDFLNSNELEEDLNLTLNSKTAVCTFHPITVAGDNGLSELENLIEGLEASSLEAIIFTLPNMDPGNLEFRKAILNYSETSSKSIHCFESLGHKNYISLLKVVELVVGNSSSGLIEAPFFSRKVLNIGSRQEGRLSDPKFVKNIAADAKQIQNAINQSLKAPILKTPSLLHGDGNTTDKILKTLAKTDFSKLLKKDFYDQV